MQSSHASGPENSTQQSFSLQAKIILLVIAILGALGAVTLVYVSRLDKKYHALQEATLADARFQFNNTLTDLLYERYGDVQAFAVNPVLQARDTKAIEATLNQYVNLYKVYESIVLVDLQGKVIASNTKGPTGTLLDVSKLASQDFSSAPWFQAAKKEDYTDDKSRNISGSYVGKVGSDTLSESMTGKPVFGMHFSTLIKDSRGTPLAVLTTRTNLSWVESEALGVTTSLAAGDIKTATISIVDGEGTTIFDFNTSHGSSAPAELAKLTSANGQSQDSINAKSGTTGTITVMHPLDKKEVVSAYGPVVSDNFPSALGWTLKVRADRDEMFATETKTMNEFYMAFFSVLLASLVVSYLGSRAISKRFAQVTAKLKSSSERAAGVARELTSASGSAAASTLEQAAAVQETVASMAEMSSMIAQTSQNVRESMTLIPIPETRSA